MGGSRSPSFQTWFFLLFSRTPHSGFSSHPTGCCSLVSSYWFLLFSSNSRCWRAIEFSFFPFLSIYIPSPGNFDLSCEFKFYVYTINSQICIFSPDLSSELQTWLPNCLLKTSFWMTDGDIKLNMSKMELLVHSLQGPLPAVFPPSFDDDSRPKFLQSTFFLLFFSYPTSNPPANSTSKICLIISYHFLWSTSVSNHRLYLDDRNSCLTSFPASPLGSL